MVGAVVGMQHRGMKRLLELVAPLECHNDIENLMPAPWPLYPKTGLSVFIPRSNEHAPIERTEPSWRALQKYFHARTDL